MKIIHTKVPDDLHRLFRLRCFEEGVTMQDVVVKGIDEYVGSVPDIGNEGEGDDAGPVPEPSQPGGKMVPGDAPGTHVEMPIPEDEKKGWPSESDMLKAASLSKKIQTAKGPERAKLLKEQAKLMER